MAEVIYLFTRSAAVGGPLVNGVVAMLFNSDDAVNTTDALRFAAAIEAANDQAASTASVPFYDNYFDTLTAITSASGELADPGDAFVIGSFDGAAKVEG
jgi:hypothetical protein